MQALGIILQLAGYIGMILFPAKFGFATHMDAYKHVPHRILGLNGYYFWVLSWALIIVGITLTVAPNVTLEGVSLQEWSTVVIALTTICYTIGTLYLWHTTRDSLRMNILVGLLQSQLLPKEDFETLLKETVSEGKGLWSRKAALAIERAVKESSRT
jgi:hypothetical protein